MRVSRTGSERNHGVSSAEFTLALIGWQPSLRSVRFGAFSVADFNTSAHHDWGVYLGLNECRLLIEALAVGLSEADGTEIAKALAPCLSSLLKIAVACSEAPAERG
jgi:hypothetical protein